MQREVSASASRGRWSLGGPEMTWGLEIHIGEFGGGTVAPPVDGARRKGSWP